MTNERWAQGRFDLHVHTTASDGVFTPAQIVAQAAAAGLAGLAITDHDTLTGFGAAAEAARGWGLTLICGVELSCECAGVEVHILGYFLDWRRPGLRRRLQELSQHRQLRCQQILARLAANGMPLAKELAQSFPGRGVIARQMAAAGYVADKDEAFAKWLNPGCPAYVPRLHLPAAEAVGLLHQAGGVAVLAHPIQAGDDSLAGQLAAAGLDGLECRHPDQPGSWQEHYCRLAERLGLAVTGGSDCHEGGLGSCWATGGELLALLARRPK